MAVNERLSLLERYHDWQGLVEALEESIRGEQEPGARARLHLWLARVLGTHFLENAKALKHFQEAYKLDPNLLEALGEARAIYWELGKLNMVRRLLELQLRSVQGEEAAPLFIELGDVATDQGDLEAATSAYQSALEAAAGQDASAAERLRDVQVEESAWRGRVSEILERADHAENGERAESLLRAARLARRFAPDDAESILARAYEADPTRPDAAALYEGLLAAAQRTESIVAAQRGILERTPDPKKQAQLAFKFGARWGGRHQNPQIGAQFIEETLQRQPDNEAAFAFLRQVYGYQLGDWSRVVGLADQLASRVDGPSAGFLWANAASVSLVELRDEQRAHGYYSRLAKVAPGHTALPRTLDRVSDEPGPKNGASMTAQANADGVVSNGESELPEMEQQLGSSVRPTAAAAEETPRVADAEPVRASYSEPAPAAASQPPPAAASPPPVATASQAPRAVMSDAPRRPSEPAPVVVLEASKLNELRARLAQQEKENRPNEFVKTLIALADGSPDTAERVGYYVRAADLYSNKFMNQAEAVKAYEKLIQIEPEHALANEYLRQMYERRRDWEKLVALRRAEAERMQDDNARRALYKERALLANERIKKPGVCIELWQAVVNDNPDDLDALQALSKLYERERDYERLADVLERLSEVVVGDERVQLLTKLGQVVGDRLKDEDRAISVYKTLVSLAPEDRRFQEQLKKRYIALNRWDELDEFYAASGRWEEFIRVLESHEARAEDTNQRLTMLAKIAALWEKQRERPERASKAYEKMLSLDPTNRQAAEHLIPIYQKGNNPRGLAGSLEVTLAYASEPEERLGILRQLAELYETRLADKQRAMDRYRSAFEIVPTDAQVQTDLERLAEALGDWRPLIDSYRAAIAASEREGDFVALSQLRLRLGNVLVERVGNVEDALLEYRAVYDAEPENRDALAALERLYLQSGRHAELLEVYTRRRDLTEDAEESREIARQIAELYENQLGDRDAAIESYQAVLQYDPLDGRALAALDRLFQAAGDWSRYAETLERRLELDIGEAELVDLKYRLAEALRLHLGDAPRALATYREVLTMTPDHAGARAALEGMLDDPELGGTAATVLENIYEVLGDWNQLIHVSAILARTADDPDRKVELYAKIAQTAEHRLGDSRRAFEAQSKALQANPAREDSLVEIERLAGESGEWQRLVALYHEIADQLVHGELSRSYRMRSAFNEERLGDVTSAARTYQRLLETDPADLEALQAVDALYRNAGLWDELIGVFRRRIDLAQTAEESAELFTQLAQVQEEKLARPDEAIGAYREVLALDPTNERALGALDNLYSKEERWRDLADNLETRLKLADTEDKQRHLMLRLASVFEQRLGQVDRAVDTYREILERDAYDASALAALERLGVGEHELAIAEILEPFYRQHGDYEKLVRVYEVMVRYADDKARQVELLHRIAALHEDVGGNVDTAFHSYARALAIDPQDETTRNGLDRLARSTGRFAQLAQVFEDLAARVDDRQIAAELYASAARVVHADVVDVERAIQLYRKVLEIEPRNLDAVDALRGLFQTAERYADMSVILQRKAQILDEPSEKKEALFAAASLEEDVLSRPESAIEVYEAVLEIDQEDLRALDALINLYLALGRWEALIATQQKKVDLVSEADEKKAIFYQVGAVYERELKDVPRSIDTYQRVLELDPDDLTALGRLDVLYQTAGDWAELLTVLSKEAELTSDPAEAISYQYRIAELYERRLDDTERAVELYRDILNIQTDHAPTLQALEGIKSGSSAQALAAAHALEPVYDAMAEWERLIGALEVQARFAEDSFGRVELLHRIATLYEDRRSDVDGAFDVYARAVAVDSQNEDSLGALERLAGVTGRWSDVARIYGEELARLGDEPERQVELGLRVAQVYEVQLENVDAAVRQYQTVLEKSPDNQGAIRALSRLFQRAERYADLAEVLKREAAIGQTPDEILDSKYRLGQVYQNHLGDIEQAVQSYEEVLSAAPEDERARRALEGLFAEGKSRAAIARILEPLYQASAEWEPLVQVHEAQLAELSDPDERLEMYFRISDDHESKLSDNAQAFAVLARALAEQPLNERLREEMERLASSFDGGWEDLANTYADVMSVDGTPPNVQAEIGRHLARVFEQELADVEKAEEAYRYVLTVVPGEQSALENLDRIYLSLEQWPELAGVLEQRAQTAEDQHDKVELYCRLGRVYEEHLAQSGAAIRAYRLVFDELEPQNAEVSNALVRIYEKRQEWRELEEVYKRQLQGALGDVEQAEIRAKLARLASDYLGRDEDAIDGWKRVLDLRGEDPEALDALAKLYEKHERWAELSDLLERLYEVALDDDARVNALSRRARLFTEPLGRHEEALEAWQRVLEIDFSNVIALRSIAKLRRDKSEHQDLVLALHQIVDRVSDRLDSVELREVHREVARLYANVLNQPEDAVESWKQLLGVDAGDLEAMAELEKIYRSDERWPEVVGVKQQRAAALSDPDAKITELLEAAAIWRDQVKEYDNAVDVLNGVLAVDPAHQFAFQELEKLHTRAERWEPLVELYLGRLEATTEARDKSDLLRRIARVFEKHLADENQAFDALVSAFAEDYGDDETVQYLERMAQSTQRWGELITTTNGWLQEEQDDKNKIALCLRLGKWYGDNLGRPEYAQPYYAQITQLDPNNAQVLRQMAHIYRQGAQWKKMGDTLYKALNVAVSNDDRKVILVDLGQLLEKHMQDREQGINHYRRALEIDAYHLPALDALERLFADSNESDELAGILVRKTKALREPEEIAAVHLRLGELYEHRLSSFELARDAYKQVVEYNGASVPALRGLERVYTKLKKWGDLADVLERQFDVVETERERVDILLKLAGIHEEQFLKYDVAAEKLERVLTLDPAELRAYVALERCYRRLKQWREFVATCERHIGELTESDAKVKLYEEIAQVYADEIEELDRSIDAYQNILDFDPNHLPALEALARLYEKQGDPARSIEMMIRVADLTADGGQRVEMYYRIGKALEDKLSDRGQARERFEMALDLDPKHVPSLSALRAIAKDDADWDAVARYLEQEQQHTASSRSRAKLLVELGRVREDALAEHDGAIQAFERAMQCDPECEEAALPLVEEYVQNERWAAAEPLAEMLVRKSKGGDRAEQLRLNRMLGKVLEALGKDQEALQAYQAAHQLDVTDPETVRGLAAVSFRLRDWPSALTNYQKVLTALTDDDVEERTQVYYRLGCVKRAQDQLKQAINNFEKALSLDPDHRDSLQALVEIYSKQSEWNLVADYKRRILDLLLDDDERLRLLVEIAEVWGDRDRNAQKAIEALEEARELRPQDHVLLHRLLHFYQESGDWQNMVDTLSAISELETEPKRKARYFYTMAQLYRDKIQDMDRAVELFNDALDLDGEFLEAFERINKILTVEKNWKQLERQYRKMLHRVAGKGKMELEFNLWHQLGLVYRDRIADVQPALEAFKMAASLRPDDPQERVILSELYEVAGQLDEAISEQQALVKQNPLTVAPYRALYRLYKGKRAHDPTWCVAAALVFMQQAGSEEDKTFEKNRVQGMPQVRGRLTNELWSRHLMHTDENAYVSKIFEMLTPAALQAKVAMLKAKGQLPELDRRLLQDPKTSTVTFAKTFGWAAHILGVHAPELYVRSDIPGSVVAVPMIPPASLAGQTVLTGFSPQELTFICGKHLASYRGEHYIRTLFPTQAELTILLFAGVTLAAPNTPMPADMAQQIRVTAQELSRYIQPVQLEGLRTVVKRFMEEGAKANIKRWNHAVDMTAARAGLLLCGDLNICKKVLSSEQNRPGEPTAAEKMKDLLAFSVSEDYEKLRQAIGVSVTSE
jgi:tetratricopeptide (TPR) repeat protein